MSNEGATGEEVPEAVADWLGEIAEQRGVSEAELLGALLRADEPGAGGGSGDDRRVDHLETEFRELIEDVRERVVQVKREADGKAPAKHDHRDLRASMEQLGHEVGAVAAELEALDDRVADGFENYEEVLSYLTETTDDLQGKVGRLASAVVDLRERIGSAAREEVRRTALSHLAETANRHGVDRARCETCDEAVAIGLLVEPRCPHCDASFSSLEPRRGFFRTSVLHTGSLPALESGPDAPDEDIRAFVDGEPADLEELAVREDADVAGEAATDDGGDVERDDGGDAESDEPAGAESGAGGSAAVESGRTVDAAVDGTAGTEADVELDEILQDDDEGQVPRGDDELEALDGVGPTYADRLAAAGVPSLRTLAGADPDEVASAVGVSAGTVADWVEQAGVLTGDPSDLDGVGPTYAGRLEAAGVATLRALAGADSESLGAAIDVPASTVADWIEQAEARTASRGES